MQWLKGQEVVRHGRGHLPLKIDIRNVVSFTGINRITVAVNKTLTPNTLPPGTKEYKTDTNKFALTPVLFLFDNKALF